MSNTDYTPKDTINKENVCILACDDNELIAQCLELFLKGFTRFKVVKSGREAIDEALTGNYQICIIDLNMPDIDGYEVAKQVREYANKNDRKILIYSHSAAEEGEFNDDPNFDGVLMKPLDVEILKAIIEENFGNIKI